MGLLEMISTPVYKKCSHCKEIKPLDDFGRSKNEKDGLAPDCRLCKAGWGREYYYQNRDRIIARQMQYQREHIERKRERGRIYYYRHWEERIAYSREYNAKRDKQYYREEARRYYHQMQDEAGCHWEPQSFYPSYRFIKALEEAEIIEIKV